MALRPDVLVVHLQRTLSISREIQGALAMPGKHHLHELLCTPGTAREAQALAHSRCKGRGKVPFEK
jgi:glycine/D-amino acid oxidase-like deaminating enzyme